MIDLRLLDEVSWHGTPLPGGRTHALLAALVAAGGQVAEERLVDEVWGPGRRPGQPGQGAAGRGLPRARADRPPRWSPHRPWLPARAHLGRGRRRWRCATPWSVPARPRAATTWSGHATWPEWRSPLPAPGSAAEGPLGELRAAGGPAPHDRDRGARPGPVRARRPRRGAAAARQQAAGDEASVGGAAALDRRRPRRPRPPWRPTSGTAPTSPTGSASTRVRRLQAVHGELLAADRPVREGLRFEATSLVGRDEDIRALRAAVREARVTSILGPGGLGKTRLAHLLGREAEQPVVHFVELVGVASPEDVVGEVGSALGVRDSVSGRRVLTAEQRNDVRARIAQVLDQAPTLLILDNCEHVVAAVADLVAYLVATCQPAARRHHHPGTAGDRRRAGLPAGPAQRRRRRRPVRAARLGGPPGRARSTTTRCSASYAGSTGYRWPSSSPPPRCGSCRSRTSTAASTTGSRCCAAATAAHPTGTRRWSRSSTGRGTCSPRPSAARCAGSRSSTTASRWTAPGALLGLRRPRRWSSR